MSRLLPVLLCFAGCSGPGHISKLFGGDRNVERIASPERVEAFRLGSPKTKEEAALIYSQWPVLVGPVVVDPKIAAELSTALLEEKTYCMWDEGKGCIPRPGLMLRFSRESQSIDVVFCFECHMVFTFQGSREVWGGNFDYSHNMLLKLFIHIFPSDPDLPKLLFREDKP